MTTTEIQTVVAILDVVKVHGGTGLTVLAGYQFRDVITELAKKIASPSAEVIGNVFKNIIEYASFQSPHSRDAALKIGKAFLEVCRRHEDTNPGSLVDSIPPEIAVPLFNKLTYFQDGELREVLTSLLSSSLLKEGQVHPTVVSVVDRLTSGEAKILKLFSKSQNFGPWPCLTVKAGIAARTDAEKIPPQSNLELALPAEAVWVYQTFIVNSGGRTGYRDIGAQFVSDLGCSALFPRRDDAFFCATNLRLLGLVEQTTGYLENQHAYVALIGRAYEYVELARGTTGQEPILEVSKLSITSLGRRVLASFKAI
jgi:Abortive infection alpha